MAAQSSSTRPARVAEQRRVQGRRRVKTGAIDLEAITEPIGLWHADPAARRYGQQLRARGKA
jgi:hypothetical protein